MPNTSKITSNRSGFSLIDILLTVVILVIFISILLIGSGSFLTTRRTSLLNLASQIASNRIDTLRNQAKTAFNSITTQSFTNPELQKLPGGVGNQIVSNYQGNSDIKLVSITVSWTEKSVTKSAKIETVIYQNGIN